MTTTAHEVEEALATVPLLDAHTHLTAGKLTAGGLHDVLLYHMVISDLYAAGCPSGARLTPFPGSPTDEEARFRLEEAIPYLPHIQNTSMAWCLRVILADLYDWRQPITPANWRQLDGIIRERANDRGWPQTILDRVRIERTVTEIVRRAGGVDDVRLQYALEWGFFTRCQWGEFDTSLYELERCWGRLPESATPIGAGLRPPADRTIRTLADVHAAIDHYVRTIPYGDILATATHLSTDIDYRRIDAGEMEAALGRRAQAGPAERDVYASYVHEAFLTALEAHAGEIVFQFSLGAEPAPFETVSRLSQRTIAQLAEMIGRHPRLRFQCFLASRHANQALCTLARELPNLSLAGYWWHNFFPSAMRAVMAERLEMLPANKQIGFFSDAYSLEWAYAKAVLVRKQLAQVLAEQIMQGQHSLDTALQVGRAILYESPQSLLGIMPMSRPA
jgi:glucuronate isomerase